MKKKKWRKEKREAAEEEEEKGEGTREEKPYKFFFLGRTTPFHFSDNV